MYFNSKYNKKYHQYKSKKNFIKKKFLNNKKYRQEEDNKSDQNKNNNQTNNEKDTIYNIPGFYYDKQKNRYFSLKDKDILNEMNKKSNNINFENKIITKKSNNISNNISFFNMIHSSYILEKKTLQKLYNRVKYLKSSNYIDINYEGEKYPNNIYLFYNNKYLLILDYYTENNNNYTTIMVHDIINNKFIKKIIIEEFYNDFIILENNLILIDNITKISIINDINKIINSKNKKLNIDINNKFKIDIKNIERISMVYKWPFIIMDNNIYYYLVWNNFYYFDLNNKKIINKNNNILTKFNNEILYLPKRELTQIKYSFKINKMDIIKKYHYINFIINKDKKNKNNFYLFTSEGEIHKYKYKNDAFILKQKIVNDLLYNNPIIKIYNYYNDNYLLISNQSNIFCLDLINQNMTRLTNDDENKIDDNICSKNIKYKIKIFGFNQYLNCIIYEEKDNIIIYSLDDFSEIKKFKIDNYKYNLLTINNDIIII